MKILGLCGSLRVNSLNKKLLGEAKKIAANLGHELLTDGDVNIPLYNDDIAKAGTPDSVQTLIDLATQADVLLVASPEYNHSFTGVLKNALDWLSIGTKPLKGKVTAVFGASNGIMGTVRSQKDLKPVLQDIGMFTLARPEVYIREADTAFDEQGSLKDPKAIEQLTKLITDTLAFAQKLKG
jgi:chromate reductase, NAD(P)H dehydrogenase (quinone)